VASAAPAGHGTGHARHFSQVLAVTSLGDSGTGSLRAAIAAANATPGSATDIAFAVGGTITLASALPAINADVTIDGTTAPGYTSGGPPVVEIDCDGRAGLDFAPGAAGAQLLGSRWTTRAGTASPSTRTRSPSTKTTSA
jgi:hypothetical protein